MDKDLLSSVVIAASVGALVSGVVSEVGKWRERLGRQKELLFTSAVELSKALTARMTLLDPKTAPMSEMTVFEQTYSMLKDMMEHGKLSSANKAWLKAYSDKMVKTVNQ